MNTSAATSVSVRDIAERAAGYGIPGVIVDGNDVLAVYQATCTALTRARAGEGPTLIECKTYRHRRHTERPDQSDERPREELEAWLRQDPIEQLRARLREQQGQLGDEEWETMDREIVRAIDAAVAFAEASPVPTPESALEDVFAT